MLHWDSAEKEMTLGWQKFQNALKKKETLKQQKSTLHLQFVTFCMFNPFFFQQTSRTETTERKDKSSENMLWFTVRFVPFFNFEQNKNQVRKTNENISTSCSTNIFSDRNIAHPAKDNAKNKRWKWFLTLSPCLRTASHTFGTNSTTISAHFQWINPCQEGWNYLFHLSRHVFVVFLSFDNPEWPLVSMRTFLP